MNLTATLVSHKLSGQELDIKFLWNLSTTRQKTKFLSWLLVDPIDGCIKFAKADKTRKAIKDVADLLDKSLFEKVTDAQWQEVGKAADADAAAADAAAAAADAAAAAAYAAYAADAADAADAAAYAADAADAAYAYARQQAKKRQVEKFIEILTN